MKNNIETRIEKLDDLGNNFNIIFDLDNEEYWKLQVKFRSEDTIDILSKDINIKLNDLICSIDYIIYKDKDRLPINNWIEQIILTTKHKPAYFENKLITVKSILKIIQEVEFYNLKNYLKCKVNTY